MVWCVVWDCMWCWLFVVGVVVVIFVVQEVVVVYGGDVSVCCVMNFVDVVGDCFFVGVFVEYWFELCLVDQFVFDGQWCVQCD